MVMNTGDMVRSIYDDSPVPVVGRVVGWKDKDWVWVLWNGATKAMLEPMDELTPRR